MIWLFIESARSRPLNIHSHRRCALLRCARPDTTDKSAEMRLCLWVFCFALRRVDVVLECASRQYRLCSSPGLSKYMESRSRQTVAWYRGISNCLAIVSQLFCPEFFCLICLNKILIFVYIWNYACMHKYCYLYLYMENIYYKSY